MINTELMPEVHSEAKALFHSHARIQFVRIAPKEKGFISGIGGKTGRAAILELYQHVSENNEKGIHDWLVANTNLSFPNKKSRFDFVTALTYYATVEDVELIKNDQYEYFNELKNQYKILCAERAPDFLRSNEDISTDRKPDGIQNVLLVEGIHSLGVGNPDSEIVNSAKDISIGKIKSRIRQIKGEECLEDADLERWEHAPLLMRIASYFSNGLFGHTKSFARCANEIFDQRTDLDKGLIKTSGFEVIRELLGLDEQLQPTGSRRILIDMYRLSAASRNDLYQQIFRKFNKNISPEHPIPIVFTEAAYSGIDYLEEMIRSTRNSQETSASKTNRYNPCSLNLTDEDILEVFKSGGLISLSLESTRMGADNAGLEKLFLNTERSRAVRMLSRQISGIVSVPFAYQMTKPYKIWDCLNIGNGLGLGGKLLERYQSTNISSFLEEDLEEILNKLKKEQPTWFDNLQSKEIVEKILYRNIDEFVAANY